MSGANNPHRECFDNFSFVCTTGTLLTVAESTALHQKQLVIKVCTSCITIPGCICLSVLSYYMCLAHCENTIETGRDITPMLSALRSNNNASRRAAAQGSEDMQRTNLPRARITEG